MKNILRIKFGIVFLSMGMGFILLGLSGCNDTGFSSREVSTSSSATFVAQMDSHIEDRSHDDSEDCSAPSGTKVMICHVPPGNPAARHTICVGARGAVNGHGINFADPTAIGGHGGDTLGACGEVLPEPPAPSPSGEPPAPLPSGTPEVAPSGTPSPMPSPGVPSPVPSLVPDVPASEL